MLIADLQNCHLFLPQKAVSQATKDIDQSWQGLTHVLGILGQQEGAFKDGFFRLLAVIHIASHCFTMAFWHLHIHVKECLQILQWIKDGGINHVKSQ